MRVFGAVSAAALQAAQPAAAPFSAGAAGDLLLQAACGRAAPSKKQGQEPPPLSVREQRVLNDLLENVLPQGREQKQFCDTSRESNFLYHQWRASKKKEEEKQSTPRTPSLEKKKEKSKEESTPPTPEAKRVQGTPPLQKRPPPQRPPPPVVPNREPSKQNLKTHLLAAGAESPEAKLRQTTKEVAEGAKLDELSEPADEKTFYAGLASKLYGELIVASSAVLTLQNAAGETTTTTTADNCQVAQGGVAAQEGVAAEDEVAQMDELLLECWAEALLRGRCRSFKNFSLTDLCDRAWLLSVASAVQKERELLGEKDFSEEFTKGFCFQLAAAAANLRPDAAGLCSNLELVEKLCLSAPDGEVLWGDVLCAAEWCFRAVANGWFVGDPRKLVLKLLLQTLNAAASKCSTVRSTLLEDFAPAFLRSLSLPYHWDDVVVAPPGEDATVEELRKYAGWRFVAIVRTYCYLADGCQLFKAYFPEDQRVRFDQVLSQLQMAAVACANCLQQLAGEKQCDSSNSIAACFQAKAPPPIETPDGMYGKEARAAAFRAAQETRLRSLAEVISPRNSGVPLPGTCKFWGSNSATARRLLRQQMYKYLTPEQIRALLPPFVDKTHIPHRHGSLPSLYREGSMPAGLDRLWSASKNTLNSLNSFKNGRQAEGSDSKKKPGVKEPGVLSKFFLPCVGKNGNDSPRAHSQETLLNVSL